MVVLDAPFFQVVLEKVHKKFMVVLGKFPKLSIIGLIHEKFHKFMYKMREMSQCDFLSNFISFCTIVILNKWYSYIALASWSKGCRFAPTLVHWRLLHSFLYLSNLCTLYSFQVVLKIYILTISSYRRKSLLHFQNYLETVLGFGTVMGLKNRHLTI
jgi:hypothetical protein